jgi:hypothetical protein
LFSITTQYKNNRTVKQETYLLFGLPLFTTIWKIKLDRLYKRRRFLGIEFSKRVKKCSVYQFGSLPHAKIIVQNKNQKKLGVVYTCITAGYDELLQHVCQDLNWDYICFTDSPALLNQEKRGAWEILPLVFSELDAVRNARWHKIHPHLLFPDYDCSIWLDANINVLTQRLFERASDCIQDKQILSAPAHFSRMCIYDEAKVVKKGRRDDPKLIDRQMDLLKEQGFPRQCGLNETGLLFRYHHHVLCQEMMEAWWTWIRDYSRRDQLSFNYIVWSFKYKMVNFIEKPGLHDEGTHFDLTYAPTHCSAL